jgi:hypothetical protein
MFFIQDAEKLHAQTPWRDRGDQNKDLLSRNCMLDICLAALRTVKLGLNKFGYPANHWSILKKVVLVFLTNLEQMSKRTAADLDIQPTTKQQRLTCALKNSRLLPDGCCWLINTGKKILFRIKWWRVNQGINVAP